MTYVLDAHALLWFLEGNPKLGASAKEILSNNQATFVLPCIALAEVCRVISQGRSSLKNVSDLLAAVRQDQRISVMPLDMDVIERSLAPDLSSIKEMHDQLIVATGLLVALHDTVKVVTSDRNIAGAGLLEVIW